MVDQHSPWITFGIATRCCYRETWNYDSWLMAIVIDPQPFGSWRQLSIDQQVLKWWPASIEPLFTHIDWLSRLTMRKNCRARADSERERRRAKAKPKTRAVVALFYTLPSKPGVSTFQNLMEFAEDNWDNDNENISVTMWYWHGRAATVLLPRRAAFALATSNLGN